MGHMEMSRSGDSKHQFSKWCSRRKSSSPVLESISAASSVFWEGWLLSCDSDSNFNFNQKVILLLGESLIGFLSYEVCWQYQLVFN